MPSENNVETLKFILENSLRPEVLDSHPWTNSLIVLDAVEGNPELKNKTPGQQLVIAIAGHFVRMMPADAPHRSDRLDEWHGFGALASLYFAPLLFGTHVPTVPRETYERINESVLLFVFGKPNLKISQTEKDAYDLTGDEFDTPEEKIVNDWTRKGLKQLADVLAARERSISRSRGLSAVIAYGKKSSRSKPKPKKRVTISRTGIMLAAAVVLVLLALIGYGVFKAQKINGMVQTVQQDVDYLQELIAEPDMRPGKFKNIGSAISVLRKDFTTLKSETQPLFWMAPMLGFIPERGGDLAEVEHLAALADSLLASADSSYQAVAPLLDSGELSNANPSKLIGFLKENQSKLSSAQNALKQAETARAQIKPEALSPEVRNLVLNDVDPVMQMMKDSLTIAVELPLVMGAGSEGAQVYLLLVQNEDELRPTGGFITAASTVIVQDGDIGELNFVNSSELDNWYKIYPAAPWQLKEYMNSPVLVFRDSNWYTNYPTAATYAEYLYSFSSDRDVDGVIAFDQHLLVEVLRITGPIRLDDTPYPIDADNVIQYMRESKTPDKQESDSSNWNNKAFLNKLAHALLKKMLSGEVEWELVSAMLLRALNEHHLLLQVDRPDMTALLARYHWDGSVIPGTGDFLMAVDTNVGFNKTNAMVESNLTYDVDLTDTSAPTGSLTVVHTNNVQKSLVCKQWLKNHAEGEQGYPITDCYWNYLRIYKPAGTALISATPQVVPDIWMINKQKKPGQVDILEEDIKGVQGFGTLQVVPAGEALAVNFEFALPAGVLQIDDRRVTYILKAQKQPGTLAVPLMLRIHLPNNASIETAPPDAIVQNDNILYETDIRTDIEFTLIFSIP